MTKKFLPILFLFFIIGCQKDNNEVLVPADRDNTIAFSVTHKDNWQDSATKAAGNTGYRSDVFKMDCEEDASEIGDIFIFMSEEEIQPDIKTKSSEEIQEGSFGVFAYKGNGDVPESYDPEDDVTPFQKIYNLPLDSNGRYDGEDDGGNIYAPGAGTWLYFYAYGPYMPITPDDQTPPLALRSGSNYPYIEYTATPELAKSTNLIFGGTSKPISGEVREVVQLSLTHILSRIRIELGNIAAGRINSVAIKNIRNKGTFNLENNNEWDLSESICDYSKTSTEGNVSFDDIFVLPQTLSDDAVIEIKILVENEETGRVSQYTLTKNLNAFISEWKSNKSYTFTISTPHEAEVYINDEVVTEGGYPIKKNLTIRNSGLSDIYIRVDLYGAWIIDEMVDSGTMQIIVSSWKNTGDETSDDGIFDWGTTKPSVGATNDRNWRLGEDGFYYYMKPVAPGEVLEPLFDSYKLTASSPQAGAYLNLAVLAQGVYADDVEYVFPEFVWKTTPN